MSTYHVIVILIVAIIGYLEYRRRRSQTACRAKFALQRIPYVSIPNIFVQTFRGQRLELLEYEQVRLHGKIFGTSVFGIYTIYVAEPELIKLILSKEFTSFTNRRKFPFDDPFYKALLTTAEGEQWKRIRSIVAPTFSAGKLRRMKPRLDATVDSLMANFDAAFRKSDVVNVKEMFGAFSIDTIIQVGFGIKVDSLNDPDNQVIRMSKRLFSNDLSIRGLLFFMFFLAMPRLFQKLGKLINFQQDFVLFFKTFSSEIIKNKRAELRQTNATLGKANNLLEILLEAEAEYELLVKKDNAKESENEQGKSDNVDQSTNKAIKFMTTDELIAQCVTFLISAFDTTTSAISLASYQLALHPPIQERLYDEINNYVMQNHAKHDDNEQVDPLKCISFETLSKFEYLNAIIDETLRLYPPAALERTASQDIMLRTEDGRFTLDIRKDDMIRIPVYSLHHDAEQFCDPERFDPDRFLSGQNAADGTEIYEHTKKSTYHKYAYLPFGSGPRNCVAKSLALYEAKLALLNVVWRYRLSACMQTKIPVEFYLNGQILSPKEIFLKFEKR